MATLQLMRPRADPTGELARASHKVSYSPGRAMNKSEVKQVTLALTCSIHPLSRVVICAAKYLSLQFPTILIESLRGTSAEPHVPNQQD